MSLTPYPTLRLRIAQAVARLKITPAASLRLRTSGAPGAPGAQGPAGPAGATGPQGPSVADGDKGDITVSASGATWTIDNDVVTNAKLANVSTATFKGRLTAGTGDPEDITGTQATTLLDTFTSLLKGLAPASGGGTSNFLRADGTWTAPAAGGGTLSAPQGRLTLSTGVAVMTATVSAATTIYYTSYVGDQVPIYNGSTWAMTALPGGQISVATSDTTKSPAAIGASKVNDWFVWNDGGTIRIGHGPDWTNDTTRSAGTALVLVNGIYLNNASITNGPAAQRGTYVGTTRSNGSSQLDFIYGGTSAGGTAAFFGVWNTYNRVTVSTFVSDSTSSWTYNSVTLRSANNSTGNRVSFVTGLQEDGITATYAISVVEAATGAGIVGIGLDSTSSFSGMAQPAAAVPGGSAVAGAYGFFSGGAQFGFHFLQAVEASSNTAVQTFRWTGATLGDGLVATLRM